MVFFSFSIGQTVCSFKNPTGQPMITVHISNFWRHEIYLLRKQTALKDATTSIYIACVLYYFFASLSLPFAACLSLYLSFSTCPHHAKLLSIYLCSLLINKNEIREKKNEFKHVQLKCFFFVLLLLLLLVVDFSGLNIFRCGSMPNPLMGFLTLRECPKILWMYVIVSVIIFIPCLPRRDIGSLR